MVTDSLTGNTFVAWNRLNGGDHDIFIQCVDSAGYALWDEGGKTVYEDDNYTQWDVAALLDGEGGVFVVWSDYRHRPDERFELYGQRLDNQGNLLWNPEGMKLTADSTNHKSPQLYDDGHEGFIVVYENSTDIGAQRVNSEGQILWDSTGIFLTKAPDYQCIPKTCRASESTFITIWADFRYSHDFDGDIYMQSFDLRGNILWEADGIPAVHWSYSQGYLDYGHDVVADGQGGAVVVWVDWRLLNIGNTVLFADRFSPQGQSMWQVTGKQLGNEITNGALACQVFRMRDGLMFLWEKNGGGFEATLTDYEGNFVWPDTVRTIDPHNTNENLVLAESDSVFVYVSISDEGGMHRLGSKIDLDGNQHWPNEPFIEDFPDLMQITLDGTGGMIASWRNLYRSSIEISRIYADGHVGGDTTTAIYNSDNQLPYALKLWQNYPNPFNSSTTVRLQLDSKSDLSIDIFNILGQMVHTEKRLNYEPGDYSISLNLTGYPSGVYFIKISTTSGYSDNIRITLLK